jgi:hypothetical protein
MEEKLKRNMDLSQHCTSKTPTSLGYILRGGNVNKEARVGLDTCWKEEREADHI